MSINFGVVFLITFFNAVCFHRVWRGPDVITSFYSLANLLQTLFHTNLQLVVFFINTRYFSSYIYRNTLNVKMYENRKSYTYGRNNCGFIAIKLLLITERQNAIIRVLKFLQDKIILTRHVVLLPKKF